jgi:hypothetical protein
MVRRLSLELEISVSAPATRPQEANLWCPVTAKPISSDLAKWWSAERKSEEVVGVRTSGTAQPGPSEGPLARCAVQAVTTVGSPDGLVTHPPARAEEVYGPHREAGVGRQRRGAAECGRSTAWGESRVRENRMHGLGRRRRWRSVSGTGRSGREAILPSA